MLQVRNVRHEELYKMAMRIFLPYIILLKRGEKDVQNE